MKSIYINNVDMPLASKQSLACISKQYGKKIAITEEPQKPRHKIRKPPPPPFSELYINKDKEMDRSLFSDLLSPNVSCILCNWCR